MFIKVSLLYMELYNKNLKYNKISYQSTKPLSKSYEHETQYLQTLNTGKRPYDLSSVHEAPSKYLNKSEQKGENFFLH